MAPLVILVEFRVKSHFAERFGKLISANAKASVEREPGCQRFDVLVRPEDPRQFWLYEVYDDDEAFDRHVQSRHFKIFAEAIKGQIEERSLWRLSFRSGGPKVGKTWETTGGEAKGTCKTKAKTKGKIRGKAK
jgi:autoinducer 2-degrading protein